MLCHGIAYTLSPITHRAAAAVAPISPPRRCMTLVNNIFSGQPHGTSKAKEAWPKVQWDPTTGPIPFSKTPGYTSQVFDPNWSSESPTVKRARKLYAGILISAALIALYSYTIGNDGRFKADSVSEKSKSLIQQ